MKNQELQKLIENGRPLAPLEQLDLVEMFTKQRIEYRHDHSTWGEHDYWATPLEIWDRHAGDCEDICILRLYLLHWMGFNAQMLRITYVRMEGYKEPHMVLAAYITPDPIILDNLTDGLRHAVTRPDLRPVYSFNLESFWLVRPGSWKCDYVGPADRLARWTRVLQETRRLEHDLFDVRLQ